MKTACEIIFKVRSLGVRLAMDIADWLLRYRAAGGVSGEPRHSGTFLKVKGRGSPECHGELEKLIEELGLVCYEV